MHGTNLVGLPPAVVGSVAYNDDPQPLAIRGVREMHSGFFQCLEGTASAAEAARLFQRYLDEWFGLDMPNVDAYGRRRFRSDYLCLLKGWAFDANSMEGAVLKGWVESRFGLAPSYHKAPLGRFGSPAWMGYLEEKLSCRYNIASLYQQLDLLYEFCQHVLARWIGRGQRHLALYRGMNPCSGASLPAGIHAGPCHVDLNNLVSFSGCREIAGEFGDYILSAQVPLTKVVFFNELFSHHMLKSEGEYLAIGGSYRVEVSYL